MNKQDMQKILQRLHNNQPGFNITQGVFDMWMDEFKDEDFKAVHTAVTRFIRTNTENYPVSIAKILALMPPKAKRASLTSRAYDIVYDDKGKRTLHKIVYHVEHGDAIVDEDGRFYSHPDETIHAMLVSRVKSTGMILSESEAEAERMGLIAEL